MLFRSEKVGLKLNIQKTKIMASSPITLWEIDGETVETVSDDFLAGGSKITADGDCSHEIKRCMLFERSYDIVFYYLYSRQQGMPCLGNQSVQSQQM